MNRVKNKAALITGGASGLGLASGKKLLKEGAKVIFTDIDKAKLSNIKDQIDNEFAEFFSIKLLDVTDEEIWKNVLSESVDELGGLNILLNSAGITLGADIVSTSFDIWKKVHDVNLDGVFLGCKYALPLMSQNGLGSIINLSSISGIVAGWNTAALSYTHLTLPTSDLV